MTTSSLPYNFKNAFGETSIASIGVAGTVATIGPMLLSGGVEATGTVRSFSRLQAGSSAADSGDVLLCRQVAVPSNTTKATVRLPDGADVVDVTMNIQTPPGGSAQSTVNVIVGTTAQDNRFASFTNVSAQGLYKTVTRQTSGYNSVSGASAIITVHTTAISGAIASGTSGRVNIFYVKRQ